MLLPLKLMPILGRLGVSVRALQLAGLAIDVNLALVVQARALTAQYNIRVPKRMG